MGRWGDIRSLLRHTSPPERAHNGQTRARAGTLENQTFHTWGAPSLRKRPLSPPPFLPPHPPQSQFSAEKKPGARELSGCPIGQLAGKVAEE